MTVSPAALSKRLELNKRLQTLIIMITGAFVFGFTAIAHQNNLGTISTYLIGDSATQYGWTIGSTMLGMGLGFLFASKIRNEHLLRDFLIYEILLTIIGGFSGMIAYWAFGSMDFYIWFIRFGILMTSALLIGIEDSILVRYTEVQEQNLAKSLGYVFTASFLGGAVAAFSYGYIIRGVDPKNYAIFLGTVDSVFVAVMLYYFRSQLKRWYVYMLVLALVNMSLAVVYINRQTINEVLDKQLYEDNIVKSWNSSYGKIVLTCKSGQTDGCRYFIGGELQTSLDDEARYHEPLIHPLMGWLQMSTPVFPLTIAFAGGGDGLGLREVLKYEQVEKVYIIDIDPTMTHVVARQEPLVTANGNSFADPRVEIINADAFTWFRDTTLSFDGIIVDLVDPGNETSARLYSREFYEIIKRRLNHAGAFVTQSSSPQHAAEAFWTIHLTVDSVFETTIPYATALPSFADWGFNLASEIPFDPHIILIDEDLTNSITNESWDKMVWNFQKQDLGTLESLRERGVVSTLSNQAVRVYYNNKNAWKDW